MNQEIRRHLIINGSGVASGGNFDKVKIRGDGTVNGNVNCNQVKLYGSADLSGSVTTHSTVIYGQSNITGNLESEKIKIYGQAEIRGDLLVNYFKLGGSVDIGGKLTGGEIHSLGEMTVKNGCDADAFFSKGVLNIKGTLNAEKIDIQLYYTDSHVTEIGGENIRVTKGKLLNALHVFKLLNPDSTELFTETVEGDEIFLEYTKAKVVRGNNVIIGPGCEIELVEYKNNFQQAENSKVNENNKV